MAEQPQYAYGGLNAQSITNVISPYVGGADEDLVRDFLFEAELDVENEIGTLPIDADGNHDRIVRAVIRDLAAGRTILRLVGSDNDEGRRSGEALIDFAWSRLQRRTESQSADDATSYVHNVFPQPPYNDPNSPAERRLGGEWPTA